METITKFVKHFYLTKKIFLLPQKIFTKIFTEIFTKKIAIPPEKRQIFTFLHFFLINYKKEKESIYDYVYNIHHINI